MCFICAFIERSFLRYVLTISGCSWVYWFTISLVRFVVGVDGFCLGNPGGTKGAVPLSVEVLPAPLTPFSVYVFTASLISSLFYSWNAPLQQFICLWIYFNVCWVIGRLQPGQLTISLSLSLFLGFSYLITGSGSSAITSSSLIGSTGSFVILNLGFVFVFALDLALTTGLIYYSWTGSWTSSSFTISSISSRVWSSSDIFGLIYLLEQNNFKY